MTAASTINRIRDIVAEVTGGPGRSFPADVGFARTGYPYSKPKMAVDGGRVVEIRWGSDFIAFIAIKAGEVIVEGWDGRVYRGSRPGSVRRMIEAIVADYDEERMRWTADPHGAGGVIGSKNL